jgi:hypothetical protein
MFVAWHGNGMACVNQTQPHCVNKMGKTQSKYLAERHGRVTAWERHVMRESVLINPADTANPFEESAADFFFIP